MFCRTWWNFPTDFCGAREQVSSEDKFRVADYWGVTALLQRLFVLAEMRIERADAGRSIRQVRAGTASPRRRAPGNKDPLAATVLRTPAFAANLRGAATQFSLPVPRDPSMRNASEREAHSVSPSASLRLSGASRLRLLLLACLFFFFFRLDRRP